MSIESMGSIIAALRREQNKKQEELADYVGVSAQAVSKWENGGAPDSALLPQIADFFGISIDALFGRSVTNYSGLDAAIAKRINDTPRDKRSALVDALCVTMQLALFGELLVPLREDNDNGGVNGYSEYHGENGGYTIVGLDKKLPFFMELPKSPAFDDFDVSADDFRAFLGVLSDKAVFDAFVLLAKTEMSRFTAKRLASELNIDAEKAEEVLSVLMKYHCVYPEDIEIDGVTHRLYDYTVGSMSVFPPILLMARRLIKGNYWFHGFMGNESNCLL